MAKSNMEPCNKGASKSSRTRKYNGSTKYFKSITPQQSGESTPVRLSPAGTRPCISPGLLAGHYAGCKFTEPPLPSALPPPPQHWMQQQQPRTTSWPCKLEPEELTRQLKTILKVQA